MSLVPRANLATTAPALAGLAALALLAGWQGRAVADKGDKASKAANADRSDRTADKDSGDDQPDKDDVKVDDTDDDQDAKPRAKASDDSKTDDKTDGTPDIQKQDLNGHDLGTEKKENVFERDRFFVDKTDTDKTEKGTLVQGSLTATSFAYHETGGLIAPDRVGIPSASEFNRLYEDLRLQTDFRHIGASRWDGRIDVRGRVVSEPGDTATDYTPAGTATIQSGLLGENELEIKEAWLVRNGVSSDVFIGRQFIPDLGGLKIDGLRIDYASSSKFTLLGFAGLYPLRGSRSITTDYEQLESEPAADGTRTPAGRFTGAGGFGAAYRTPEAYGSFGGVVLAPLSSETPRVYATSSGYWRYGSKLDFYHFVILDLVGSNTVNSGLTNLSLGVNYKPDQRLRGTLSFNRVDTETLNVQAQAFLNNPDNLNNAVQNDAYLQRIATNEARASLSAGLGELQRFEITAALAYRFRGEIDLSAPPQAGGATPASTTLPAAQSVEVYGGITDRRSIASLRLGVDGSRIFGVGSSTFERTSSTSVRAFAGRELANGHGEWDAEVDYSTTKDDDIGKTCDLTSSLASCFGAAKSSIISLGGNLYYRINRDWFAMTSLFVNRTSVTHIEMALTSDDPTVTGLSGFFRIAYRF